MNEKMESCPHCNCGSPHMVAQNVRPADMNKNKGHNQSSLVAGLVFGAIFATALAINGLVLFT